MRLLTHVLRFSLLSSTFADYCRHTIGGQIVTFCCDNAEDKNGLCIKCSDGYISIDGEPCRKCSPGVFGAKCGNKCQCKQSRCHHVNGCIEVLSSTETAATTFVQEISTVVMIETTTEDGNQDVSTKKEKTYSETTRQPIFNDSNINDTIGLKGLLQREIIIYSISSAFVLVFLVMCVLLACYKFKAFNCCKQGRLILIRKNRKGTKTESEYDSISETGMINMDSNIIEQALPMEKDPETTHGNESTEFNSSSTNGGYLIACVTTTDSSLWSSSNEHSDTCSDHSYQNMQQTKDIVHEYETCHVAHYLELLDTSALKETLFQFPVDASDTKCSITCTTGKHRHYQSNLSMHTSNKTYKNLTKKLSSSF